MSDVRYIVTAPDADDERIYRTESSATHRQCWANRDHDEPIAQVFRVDLRDIEPDLDATDEQRYQFLEARSQRDAAEADRLAKKLTAEGRGLPPVCGDDREKMREVIEAMRPIVYAAVEWRRRPIGFAATQLSEVVEAHRDRLFAAMSAWADSQTWSEAEKLREKCAAMEKVVDAAEVVADKVNGDDSFDLRRLWQEVRGYQHACKESR